VPGQCHRLILGYNDINTIVFSALSDGCCSGNEDTIPITNVTDVKLRRGFFDMLTSRGTIIISTSDPSLPLLTLDTFDAHRKYVGISEVGMDLPSWCSSFADCRF
jgi:hypothetical protein